MSDPKITPHVFISATSDDLRSARETVKNALLTIGCHPVVQEHFEPDFRTVKQMLQSRLGECQAVVHLVGKCYGGEPSPNSLPPGAARRSWTQMEHDIARELGIKIYLFVCHDDYPFDAGAEPEPPEFAALQEAHRQAILGGEQLYIQVRTPDELALRVSEIKLETDELRKAVKKGSARLAGILGIVAALLAGIFAVGFLTKSDTGDLVKGQERILTSVDEMRASFTSLANGGGVIPDPSSPEQFYHNARLHELKSDYAKARQAYLEYFRFDLEFLDPHLRFQQFLKVQEGLEGARETYQAITANSKDAASQLASALLWERSQRAEKLDLFLQSHPDFGPAYYLFSLDFSSGRVGAQSLEDKRREKALMDQFKKLDGEGNVVRWFLDQHQVAEWREDVDSRLAALEISGAAMENPVTVTWMSHNTGWTGHIQIAELTSEIFWKKPGATGFVSTGFSHARSITTGKPQPRSSIDLPLDTGKMTFEVKYRNLNGEEMGPFTAEFDPISETLVNTKQILDMTHTGWVSFRDFNGKTLLYFSQLLSYRGGLSRIDYGLDTETPDQEFAFPAYDVPGGAPITPDVQIYLEIPGTTKFVTVQVTYKDGAKSEVHRFNR